MIKKIIWSLLFISLLVSCNKERTLHVKAINAVTGLPYSGLRFVVTEEKSGAFEEEYKTVYDGNLDNNGEAYAIVKIRKNRSYSIRCEEPPNTCYNKKISYSYAVEDNKNPTFLFEFAECAELQRKVKNISCFDSNDKIEILIDNQVHSLLTAPWILNGCADYLTVVSKVPIGQYNLQWSVTKNNVTTIYNDSFILQENEFKLHEINY